MSHIRKIITFYLDLPDEARRRLLSDTILTAESARKVEKEVKAIIRAELQLNQKKKMLLFKADNEKKELEEKTQFLKNRTEFLEEENKWCNEFVDSVVNLVFNDHPFLKFHVIF